MQNNSLGLLVECSHASCERRELHNLISKANIGSANTTEGFQVEMDQISSKPTKAATSLCFASIFSGQNKISLDQVPVGPLLVFWQTYRWLSIGILLVLVPRPDSVGGRILCRKNNKKLAFSINVIFSLWFRHQITECKTFQSPHLIQLVFIEVIQNLYWLMPFLM